MARNRGRRLAHPLPLPKDTVLCGELTLDPSQPHNNVLPFPSDLPLDIRSEIIREVHNTQATGSGAGFWVQLMTFLKAQARALQLDDVKISVPSRYQVSGPQLRTLSQDGMRQARRPNLVGRARYR